MDFKDFSLGQRVQMHPATDTWMRGDRYGEIVGIGRRYLHVWMDRSARVVKVAPSGILEVIENV